MGKLFNITSYLKDDSKQLSHPYKGKVVDTDEKEEEKLGRIKVDIPELWGDNANDPGGLPWVYPKYGSTYIREFGVPDKGDVVEVEFQYGNRYLPVYTNKPLFDFDEEPDKLPDEFKTENYPKVYGNWDSIGNKYYVDKVTGKVTYYHKSGTKLEISGDGDIKATNPTGSFITIDKDGNMTMDCTGKAINMKADSINMEATNYNVKATSDFKGTIHCDSNITSDTDAIAKGISLVNHTHPYTWTDGPGSGNTSKPS